MREVSDVNRLLEARPSLPREAAPCLYGAKGYYRLRIGRRTRPHSLSISCKSTPVPVRGLGMGKAIRRTVSCWRHLSHSSAVGVGKAIDPENSGMSVQGVQPRASSKCMYVAQLKVQHPPNGIGLADGGILWFNLLVCDFVHLAAHLILNAYWHCNRNLRASVG